MSTPTTSDLFQSPHDTWIGGYNQPTTRTLYVLVDQLFREIGVKLVKGCESQIRSRLKVYEM